MSVAVSSMSEPPSAVSGPVRGVSVPVELGVSGGLWAVSVGAVQMALLRPQFVPPFLPKGFWRPDGAFGRGPGPRLGSI